MLPILWNGFSLIHFTVVHTHAICGDKAAHYDQNIVNCTAVCQLTHESNNSPAPSPNNDFQEIKQYLTLQILHKKVGQLTTQSRNFVLIPLSDTPFFQDVLHPPILT
ncbi:MAG: hypothetical protein AAF960_03930 [Bacteroidota bacterium]